VTRQMLKALCGKPDLTVLAIYCNIAKRTWLNAVKNIDVLLLLLLMGKYIHQYCNLPIGHVYK